MQMTALAADIKMESRLPSASPITVNTTVVGFVGQKWWVIGYTMEVLYTPLLGISTVLHCLLSILLKTSMEI